MNANLSLGDIKIVKRIWKCAQIDYSSKNEILWKHDQTPPHSNKKDNCHEVGWAGGGRVWEKLGEGKEHEQNTSHKHFKQKLS